MFDDLLESIWNARAEISGEWSFLVCPPGLITRRLGFNAANRSVKKRAYSEPGTPPHTVEPQALARRDGGELETEENHSHVVVG